MPPKKTCPQENILYVQQMCTFHIHYETKSCHFQKSTDSADTTTLRVSVYLFYVFCVFCYNDCKMSQRFEWLCDRINHWFMNVSLTFTIILYYSTPSLAVI